MTDQKKAGIVIDSWKLPIFERHLEQSGYRFDQAGLAPGVTVLKVHTNNLVALEAVVRAANTEAAGVGTQQ